MFKERIILLALFAFLLTILLASCRQAEKKEGNIKLKVANLAEISRADELITLKVPELKEEDPSFNEKAFYITEKKTELPSQLDRKGDIIFIASFAPKETKEIIIHYTSGVKKNAYKKMTQAVLGIKTNYNKVNGYYTGGKFVDIDSVTVPKDHFAHDALYRFEGPGWESDKVAYRFYLDSRNRTDIFGKKNNDLVLDKIGINDLVSDSKESYTKMLDWGMDIFKVGESLGIGSVAMWDGSKFQTVSKVEQVKCYVENGPIKSGVNTKYLNWEVGGKKYDLFSDLTISAGSRLTDVNLKISDDDVLMCTGLAKHENCTLIKSAKDNLDWGYIALYGKQSLSGDDLGIAIFYKKSNFVKTSTDDTSEILVLKTNKGKLNYYFASAWQQEPNGIKNIREFKKYLNNTAVRLSTPLKFQFN